MKYLKEFANVEENRDYAIITNGEYATLLNTDILDFTYQELNIIKTIFPFAKYLSNDTKKYIKFKIFTFDNVWESLKITKLEDEYYLINSLHESIFTDTYRCDQIKGLLDCLKMFKTQDF